MNEVTVSAILNEIGAIGLIVTTALFLAKYLPKLVNMYHAKKGITYDGSFWHQQSTPCKTHHWAREKGSELWKCTVCSQALSSRRKPPEE